MEHYTFGMPRALVLLVAAVLASGDKDKGVTLSLRATPRVSPAPARVLFTASLEGGADVDVYCATLEWEWGDGTKTSQEGECPAFVPGETPVERFYEVEHTYTKQARPVVRLRLLKEGKPLAQARVNIVVGSPYQKPSIEVQER